MNFKLPENEQLVCGFVIKGMFSQLHFSSIVPFISMILCYQRVIFLYLLSQ